MIAQCSSYFSRLTGIEGLSYNKVVAVEWWPNASLRVAGLRDNRCLTQALNSRSARQGRDQCHLNRASECQEGLRGQLVRARVGGMALVDLISEALVLRERHPCS